jgi:hypothetical protein
MRHLLVLVGALFLALALIGATVDKKGTPAPSGTSSISMICGVNGMMVTTSMDDHGRIASSSAVSPLC